MGKRRAIEIGVFEGVSTKVIRNGMDKSGTLFAVDPFPPGRIGISWSYLIARGELGEAVEFVRMKGVEAARAISGSFDFAFIDGDHSITAIAEDWSAWSPRILQGGLICLHDTRMRPELGSQQFFETTISQDPRFEIMEQVDSLSVLHRLTPDPMSRIVPAWCSLISATPISPDSMVRMSAPNCVSPTNSF